MAIDAEQSSPFNLPAYVSSTRAAYPTYVNGTASYACVGDVDEINIDSPQDADGPGPQANVSVC